MNQLGSSQRQCDLFLGQSEALTSLLLGIVCGGLVAGVTWLWRGTPVIGVTIGGSVLVSIFLAGVIGVTIPTLLYATHEHSKIAAGPVVHAVTYITTLLVYLTAAWWILGN